MKLSAAEIACYTLVLRRPLRTARGTITHREGWLLLLRDQQGRRGIGDAAPLAGFSRETLAETEHALRMLIEPAAPLFHARVESIDDIASLAGKLALPSAAAHALDLALLDLLAQREGCPLARLLSGRPRDRISVHALVDGSEAAREAWTRGHRTFKVKVGAGTLAQDDARIARLRQALGPEAILRLDANGAWQQASTAIAALRQLARHRPHAVEQPVPASALDALREVRNAGLLAIAADEAVRDADDLERVITSEAADAVVIKPMLCGGLQPALALARQAISAGLAVSLTTTLESPIGALGVIHLAAAIEGPLWSCGGLIGDGLFDQESSIFGQLGEGRVIDGQLAVPQQPGLGAQSLAL